MLSLQRTLIALAVVAMLAAAWLIAPRATMAQEQRPWRIGFPPWIAYDIVIYAEESGIFDRHGLDVELIRFEETSDVAHAVMRGDIDAGFSGLGTVIVNHDGTPLEVVLITDVSSGADGVVARPGIASLEDLRGRRIACKQKAINQLILAEALDLVGMSFDDIEVLDVSNATAKLLLESGQADAAVLWDPELSRLASSMDGTVLFRTSDVQSAAIDMLVVRSDTVANRRHELEAIREVWFELLEEIQTQPDTVFELVGERLRKDPKGLAKAWGGLQPGDRSLNTRMLSGEFEWWAQRASDLLRQPKPSNLRAMPLKDRGRAS